MLKLATILAAGLSMVAAYTTPTTQLPANAVTRPGLQEQVLAGSPYTVTWDKTPYDLGATITLVLHRGPGENIKPLYAIAEKVPNTGSYSWTPSLDLEDDVTHYGIQLISDADGKYQWSTQFGISNKNKPSSSVPAPPSSTKAPPTSLPPSSVPSSKPSAVWSSEPCSDEPSHPTDYPKPSGSWGGSSPGSGSGWKPSTNGTSTLTTTPYVPPVATAGYKGPLSNDAGRFTISAVSAVFALGAAVLLM